MKTLLGLVLCALSAPIAWLALYLLFHGSLIAAFILGTPVLVIQLIAVYCLTADYPRRRSVG